MILSASIILRSSEFQTAFLLSMYFPPFGFCLLFALVEPVGDGGKTDELAGFLTVVRIDDRPWEGLGFGAATGGFFAYMR